MGSKDVFEIASLDSHCDTLITLGGSNRLDRVGHAGLKRMRRKRQLDAPNTTDRVILSDESDQLLATRDGQLLAGESGLLQTLEELVHVDLLEQEASGIEDILALADHVVLDRKILISISPTVAITRGEDIEFALTIHGQELLQLRHGLFV